MAKFDMKALRKWRKKVGITQEEMGKYCGLNRTNYSRMENESGHVGNVWSKIEICKDAILGELKRKKQRSQTDTWKIERDINNFKNQKY